MNEQTNLPAWFQTIRHRNPRLAALIFRQLHRGDATQAREALFWTADDGERDRGALALLAYLAGSKAPDIVEASIDHCLALDIDVPFVESATARWSDGDRLAAIEALYKAVATRDPLKAQAHAVKAVEMGSRDAHIIQAYARQRMANGYFEELLHLKASARTVAMKALVDRAEQNTVLLRYGFAMPKPEYLEPLDNVRSDRVLHLLDNSLPLVSVGYATRTHGLLTGIAEHGFHVSAVTRLGFPHDRPDMDAAMDVAQFDDIDGIRYHRLIDPERGFGKLPIIDYLKANILAHVPLIRDERPAILHGASNFINGVAATSLAKRFGLKSVYEVRGLWELTRASREPAYMESDLFRQAARMETEACTNADRVICVTEALKLELISRGVDAGKIAVVPNGVHTDRFVPRPADSETARRLGLNDEDVVIGYVGSIVHYEGLDDLLCAIRMLVDQGYRNVKLLIVGDGDALEALQELARQLDLIDHVIFTGRVPHHEVEKYYSLVAIAPFPRLPLPVCEMVSPLKPLEAMAMEKCVVVSSVAALAEMVADVETGLVFEKGNVLSLAEALRRVIDDPTLRIRLGAQSRQWVVENRDWKVLGRAVAGLYQDILAERNSSGAEIEAAEKPPEPDCAFLYGFFSNNVGDGAVTLGGISLARKAGMQGGATIVSPMPESGRPMWRYTRELHPDMQLHEKQLRLARSADGPNGFLKKALQASSSMRRSILADYGIADAKSVFYGGGEHLFSLGRPGDDWRLLDRLFPLLLAAKQGKRIVVLPTTFGPFNSAFGRDMMRRLHAAAEVLSARDVSSADVVAALDLPRPKVLLDPAFFLESDRPFTPPPDKVDRKLVSVVMRLDGFGMRVGNEASQQRITVLEAQGYAASNSYSLYRDIGRLLLQSGNDLRLFIQCEADDRPTRLLAEDLGAQFPGRRILINKPANAHAMIHDLATGAATVTSRFHAAIFSKLSGCPAVGIYFKEHGHKTPGLFEMFGLADSCFDGAEASAETIVAKTTESIRDRDALAARLMAAIADMQAETLAEYSRHLP
ncbi:glycosyltransferase [Mesorhizobium sp. AaZ16]|uniref:glycosyltransferase n=1 Tax=Mesorhizobium sp. AaZ16 TaxID=3402289 RepID=UPI00374F7730